ncbi:MAG: hypothetical protein JWP01_3959 [Myxococcales bacterium]|nr:hypothetical protein [Myxococcales bacterium]
MTLNKMHTLGGQLGDATGDPQTLVKRETAAAVLDVSLATLHRMIRDGRVPVVHVLGKPRFRLSDLYALRQPK